MFDWISYTPLQNMAGTPAISLPLFQSSEGLPIGSMFAADRGQEDMLLALAFELEAAQPWVRRWPRHSVATFNSQTTTDDTRATAVTLATPPTSAPWCGSSRWHGSSRASRASSRQHLCLCNWCAMPMALLERCWGTLRGAIRR